MNEGYEAEQGSLTLQVDPMSVLDWIKEPQTYQVKKGTKMTYHS